MNTITKLIIINLYKYIYFLTRYAGLEMRSVLIRPYDVLTRGISAAICSTELTFVHHPKDTLFRGVVDLRRNKLCYGFVQSIIKNLQRQLHECGKQDVLIKKTMVTTGKIYKEYLFS